MRAIQTANHHVFGASQYPLLILPMCSQPLCALDSDVYVVFLKPTLPTKDP